MKGVINTLHGENLQSILYRECDVKDAFNKLYLALNNARPHGRNYKPSELEDAKLRLNKMMDQVTEMETKWIEEEIMSTFEVLSK